MTDTVYELSCNLDYMTGEELGFAMERLLEQGALDVYTIPIGMKKGRRSKLEYEDLRRIALEQEISLAQARERIRKEQNHD